MDFKTGLSEAEVLKRREIYGWNELEKEKRDSWFKLFLHQFLSPVVYLLLAACIACAAIGDWVESLLILFIVNLNALIGSYSEKNAGDALEKLAAMSAPTCTLLLEGKIVNLESKFCVPGDVVVVKTGMSVPADCRLVEAIEVRRGDWVLVLENY